MLSCLSTALGLTGNERFETWHRNSHQSNSTLATFRYVPATNTSKTVGHQKHTDIGSLTLLFRQQWGLQVLPSNSSTWGFIPPKPGHAIINVGDSLRFASGHKFHSCVHQVVPLDVPENRYSIAYFLRPESEKKFEDSKGRWLTSREWHDEKYEVFSKSHEQQATENLILTGGMR